MGFDFSFSRRGSPLLSPDFRGGGRVECGMGHYGETKVSAEQGLLTSALLTSWSNASGPWRLSCDSRDGEQHLVLYTPSASSTLYPSCHNSSLPGCCQMCPGRQNGPRRECLIWRDLCPPPRCPHCRSRLAHHPVQVRHTPRDRGPGRDTPTRHLTSAAHILSNESSRVSQLALSGRAGR